MSATFAALAPAGVLAVTGRDRLDLLHRISTNDLRPLATPGRALATVFTNEKGRIIDWVTVLARADQLWLRTSEGRASALAAWIERYTIMEDVRSRDLSGELREVVVQGPDALAAAGLPRWPEPDELYEHDGVVFLRGPKAFGPRLEALAPAARAEALLEACAERGAARRDGTALELARLLAGVPSPAHEFKDEVNPLELRIKDGAISWTKGCYIGQEVIARLDSYDKLARQLIGWEADAPVPADEELKLVRDGRPLGRVTSALWRDGGSIGLAVVKREAAGPGEAELVTAGGSIAVRLVDRPFWTP